MQSPCEDAACRSLLAYRAWLVGGAVEIRLLGPVEVYAAGSRVDVGPRQRLLVLAALAVDAGLVVPVDTLIRRVWERPPKQNRRTLHAHISGLRGVLRDVNSAGTGRSPARLLHQAAGYTLQIDRQSIDLYRFRALVAQARVASDDRAAEALFAEAARLWRGEVLAGLDSPWPNSVRALLEPERVAAELDHTDVRLRLGQHAHLVDVLAAAAAARPLDERVAGQYMLALYRCGRQADALAHYERVRKRLENRVAVLSPSLRELRQQILSGGSHLFLASDGIVRDRAADIDDAGALAHQTRLRIPAQLPADVGGFTGRHDELAWLDGYLPTKPTDEQAATVPIVVVSGTAGVGKTALVVKWARSVQERFPDGQLYVNMRGYDDRDPLTAAVALGAFLRALGVDDKRIPVDLDERAGRFRSELTARRVLIVIDNAATVDQVRPLLPGAPSCAVAVTSRDSLAGLVARDGARRLDLDLLPEPDAVTLLRTLIGDRADAEPDATATLAKRCARLPLALRVAAELAVSRPRSSLAELVAGLADEQERLTHLDRRGDSRTRVAAVFSWSLRHLSPATAHVFALLGQHPGREFDDYAVAALAGVDVDTARHEMDTLSRAHLVENVDSGRYSVHDLLRIYARGLEPEDPAASERLVEFYLATVFDAAQLVSPTEARRSRFARSASVMRPLVDVADAVDWLNRECANLVAIAGFAAHNGWPKHATELSGLLFSYLVGRGDNEVALAIHTHAGHAASILDDRGASAWTSFRLGVTFRRQGRMDAAVEHITRAISMFRETGDAAGQGRALTNLAEFHKIRGSYQRSLELDIEALVLLRRAGDRISEAGTLNNMGTAHWAMGNTPQAVTCYEEALALFCEADDPLGEAIAAANLAEAEARLGRHEAAMQHCERSLTLVRSLGDRRGEAYTLEILGGIQTQLGRVDLGVVHLRRALEIFGVLSDRAGEATALNSLGEAANHVGDAAGAHSFHAAALDIAGGTEARDQEARAHLGLGLTAERRGNLALARTHYTAALDLYRTLGSSRAERAAGRLARVAAAAGS